jgi:hypothetical protein
MNKIKRLKKGVAETESVTITHTNESDVGWVWAIVAADEFWLKAFANGIDAVRHAIARGYHVAGVTDESRVPVEYDTAEAAALAGVGTSTIRANISNGHLKARLRDASRKRSYWMIAEVDLLAWIARRESGELFGLRHLRRQKQK